jgi:D-3-phosphoglycerate dehydrogenase / 2-oxoglutarate reductase
MQVFVTHNPEDLTAYFGRALPELRRVAEVSLNPLDRNLTTAELIDAAANCQVIVAHRATPGEAELFVQRPELIAFLRCAVDISTVDVAAANATGVLVARADKSFIASTAELALGLLIDVARNISASNNDYHDGRVPLQRPGYQLRGRTAGIIGYGAIGSYLADLLMALGMTVLVHDPYVDETADGVESTDLHQLLARADAIFPLAPADASTANLIGAPELAQITPGAVLINVSRGELLDEDAVVDALDSGRLGGLAMDVGRAADQRPSSLLASRPGVVSTPHLGGLTPENADAQAASSVEQVRAIIERVVPPRTVNADHATRLRKYWAR